MKHTQHFHKNVSDSYPLLSLARNYGIPYWVVLNIGHGFLKDKRTDIPEGTPPEAEVTYMFELEPNELYWPTKALAWLTAHIGQMEGTAETRALFMSEVLNLTAYYVKRARRPKI